MKLAKLKFIDNGNITDKHLGRRGLHLNRNGNIIFAKKLLNAIRSWYGNNDLVFNIYDNNFMKPTKKVNNMKQKFWINKDDLINIESWIRCIWSTKT